MLSIRLVKIKTVLMLTRSLLWDLSVNIKEYVNMDNKRLMELLLTVNMNQHMYFSGKGLMRTMELMHCAQPLSVNMKHAMQLLP